jgi:multidrug efflux pump subunit AcrA (membrane-fusion protein)
LLGLYGTASTAYLLIVFFGIWKFLSAALAPHGLKWLSDILVLSWAATSLIAPAISSLKNIAARVKSAPAVGQKRALLIVTTAFALAVVGFAIPLPRKITCNGILQPASTTSVRATEEGCVVKILVSEGERVAAGQPLALLENHALMRDAETAKSAEKTARTRLRSAMATAKTSAVGLLQSELLAAESSLREANRRLEGVTLRSPTEGIVASRRLDAFLGTRLAPGEVFCDIRPAVLDEFLVTFGEKEARLVHAGARAVVRFRALPGKSFIGVVAAPPLRLAKPSPGQPAPTPGSDSHFANITLSNPDEMLKIGMTGRVQIERGRESLFQTTLEALLDFLHLDVRMR